MGEVTTRELVRRAWRETLTDARVERRGTLRRSRRFTQAITTGLALLRLVFAALRLALSPRPWRDTGPTHGGHRPSRTTADAVRLELRYAFRQLLRHPGHSLAIIATLAVGIGGVVAVFSVSYGILLRPLPISRPAEVLAVVQQSSGAPGAHIAVSGARFDLWRQLNGIFVDMAAASSHAFDIMVDRTAVRVRGELVSGNFFEVLGVAPLRGRTFTSNF
jgi:hypothetical protein